MQVFMAPARLQTDEYVVGKVAVGDGSHDLCRTWFDPATMRCNDDHFRLSVPGFDRVIFVKNFSPRELVKRGISVHMVVYSSATQI